MLKLLKYHRVTFIAEFRRASYISLLCWKNIFDKWSGWRCLVLLSDENLNMNHVAIFSYTVRYHWQDGGEEAARKDRINAIGNILLMKPYIPFIISKNMATGLSRYASVQSCHISYDHRLVHNLCDIYSGSLQTPTTVSFNAKIKDGNCTRFIKEQCLGVMPDTCSIKIW